MTKLSTRIASPANPVVPRVTFVASHPIQYQVPIFRLLAASDEIDFRVFFAMLPDATTQGAGFGVEFEWDIPLLEGYSYEVLENVSAQPGLTHFRGCDTPGILQELKRREVDVVIVNGWVVKTCLQTLRACRKLRIPCMVRGEANHLRPRAWWKRLLQRQLIRRYDVFLPIGSANRAFYRSYGIEDIRMFDAPYCIENRRFQSAAKQFLPDRDVDRRRWSIGENQTCFLFCGKFESKKYPMELIHAFEVAVQDEASIAGGSVGTMRLLMVGDGELRAECERYSIERELPITFAGFLNQSEIVRSYVASDCLVLPSDHGETWGLVVNEAMACGLPAIVSDQVGCAGDLIVEGETGWVFPFGDWARLMRLMILANQNQEKTRSMRPYCLERVSRYSPEIAAEGILDAVRFATDTKSDHR